MHKSFLSEAYTDPATSVPSERIAAMSTEAGSEINLYHKYHLISYMGHAVSVAYTTCSIYYYSVHQPHPRRFPLTCVYPTSTTTATIRITCHVLPLDRLRPESAPF